MPMTGRVAVMSNSTTYWRKKTSPTRSPDIPAGEGCTHVWSLSARYHDSKGIFHVFWPTVSQKFLPFSHFAAKSSHGTLASCPFMLSLGITRHDVPESMMEGAPYCFCEVDLNWRSSTASEGECPKVSDEAPTIKSSSERAGVYHIVSATVEGSYPPSCTSAAVSVEKKENLRWRLAALVSLFSSSVIAKSTGVGRSLPSLGRPKPRMPSTPLKSGELQSVMTPKGDVALYEPMNTWSTPEKPRRWDPSA
mmetsp:Transcript_11288/g.26270  ORF Transcript_11288/g.26270 Transcript_11288/m.26270 type:complete len:250 (-) Transcript_11288:451-1200(-)